MVAKLKVILGVFRKDLIFGNIFLCKVLIGIFFVFVILKEQRFREIKFDTSDLLGRA